MLKWEKTCLVLMLVEKCGSLIRVSRELFSRTMSNSVRILQSTLRCRPRSYVVTISKTPLKEFIINIYMVGVGTLVNLNMTEI